MKQEEDGLKLRILAALEGPCKSIINLAIHSMSSRFFYREKFPVLEKGEMVTN